MQKRKKQLYRRILIRLRGRLIIVRGFATEEQMRQELLESMQQGHYEEITERDIAGTDTLGFTRDIGVVGTVRQMSDAEIEAIVAEGHASGFVAQLRDVAEFVGERQRDTVDLENLEVNPLTDEEISKSRLVKQRKKVTPTQCASSEEGIMQTDFDAQDIKALASSYIDLLLTPSGQPIALFYDDDEAVAIFLRQGIAPVAKSRGFRIVQVDLRPHSLQPLGAINARLEQELHHLAAIEPSLLDSLPDRPEFRLDSLVNRITSQTAMLLILENLDALLDGPAPRDTVGSIRAVLQMRKPLLTAIFTSSSRKGLTQIFGLRTEPMYLFAHQRDLP